MLTISGLKTPIDGISSLGVGVSLLTLCLVSVTPPAYGQTTVFRESFDSAKQFTVTKGTTGGGTSDYFKITDGSDISKSYTNTSGTFLAGQDTDGFSETPIEIQWDDIEISKARDLTFKGRFGEDFDSPGDIDDDDFLRVEYRVDDGAWHKLIAFRNDGSSFNSAFFEDTNFDGVGDGSRISSADGSLIEFSKDLSATGTTLDLRFRAKVDAGDEDFAIDDFAIVGDLGPTVQFASAGNRVEESSETATLAVERSNPDGTVVSVDVTMDRSASTANSDDVDNFTTTTVSFPDGASTGVTETIPINLTDDETREGTETAIFQLQNLTTSGDASIASPSRFRLEIADDDLSLPFTEDFENADLFTVEAGALGADGSDNYFILDDGSDINKGYTGAKGRFLAGQDTDDPDITGGAAPVQIQWRGIDVSGASELVFTGHFGEVDDAGNSGGDFDRDDFLRVEYRIDAGQWQSLIAFRNDGSSHNSNLFLDPDKDGVGEGRTISSSSGTLAQIEERLTNQGSTLDLRFAAHTDAGDEDFAVDRFSLRAVNQPPTANADQYKAQAGQPLRVQSPDQGVLANDTDPEGHSLSASVVSGPAAGTLKLNGDGTFTYQPSRDFGGTDEFTYEVSDGNGKSDRAPVTLAVNAPPEASDDRFTLEPRDHPVLNIGPPGVLANDTDANRDDLNARLVKDLYSSFHDSDLGNLTFNADGSFSYDPPEVLVGPVKFAYEVSDGNGRTDRATATIEKASGGPFDLIGILLSKPVDGTQATGRSGVRLLWTGPARLAGALDGGNAKDEEGLSVELAHRGPETKHYSPVEADVQAETVGSAPKGTQSEEEWREYTARITDLTPGIHRFAVRVLGTGGEVLASKKTQAMIRMKEPLRLEPPAPNPVRSEATLQFAIRKRTETRLILYNMLGQKIETLYRGTPSAGTTQDVRFDASTRSSGTYILRLEAGDRSTTRTITVVR